MVDTDKEDVQKEDVQKEDVQKEDVQKEDVQKEDVQIEEVQTEEVGTEEVKKVDISKITEEKQEVNQVAFSTETENKQYDSLELLELTFKLLNKNKKKVLEYIAKLVGAFIIVLIPCGLMFAALGLFEADIYNSYNKPREIMGEMEALFSVGIVLAMLLTMLLFFVYGLAANWFMVKGVTSIDTGIERIDSKKTTVPTGSAFLKVVVLQILAGAISMTLSLMLSMTGYILPLYFMVLIQVYIASFILNNCVTFSYFEVVVKGKSLLNSFKNAVTNFFFSKNDIIIKSIVGNLLIGIVSSVVLVLLVFLGIFIVMLFAFVQIYSVAVILGVTLSVLFFLLIAYFAFFAQTYSYLMYMLNEVKEDKVDKLL